MKPISIIKAVSASAILSLTAVPAGQIGLGFGYKLSPEVDVVGGYSFLAAPTGKTVQDEVIKVHSAQLGLSHRF